MDLRSFFLLALLSSFLVACGGGGGGGGNKSSSGSDNRGSGDSSSPDAVLLPTVTLSGQTVSLSLDSGSLAARQLAARSSTILPTQKAVANIASNVLIINGLTWQPVCALNAGVQLSEGSVSVDRACISDFTVLKANGVAMGDSGLSGILHVAASRNQFLNGQIAITPLTEIAYAKVHLALAAGKPLAEISTSLDEFARRVLRGDIDANGVIDYRDLLAWRVTQTSQLRIQLTPLYDAYAESPDAGVAAFQIAQHMPLDWVPQGDSSDPITSDNGVNGLAVAGNIIYGSTWHFKLGKSDDCDVSESDVGIAVIHAMTTDGEKLWRVSMETECHTRIKVVAANDNYLAVTKINTKNHVHNALLIAPIPAASAPTFKSIAMPSPISDVALQDGEAVVATTTGLRFVNVTPAIMTVVGSASNVGASASYRDGRIYLATTDALTIFNRTVSGASQIGQINFSNPSAYAGQIAVIGTHAFVAAGLSGVFNIDISDPANPRELGGFDESSSMVSSPFIYDLALAGNTLASIGDSSLRTFMLDAEGNLQPNGRSFVQNLSGDAGGVIVGDEIYFISDENLLRTTSLGSLIGNTQSWLVGATPIDGAQTAAVTGTTAFVGTSPQDGQGKVVAVNVSNPSAPQIQREYPVGAFVFDIALHGNTAALANSTWDYQVLDLQSGSVKWFDVSGGPSVGIAPFGSYDLVFDRSGYAVFDVTNPSSPTLKGTYDRGNDSDSWSGVIDGSTLYEARGRYGLDVVQLQSSGAPANSVNILSADGAGWKGELHAWNVTKAGSTLYVAGCGTGLFVLNVSSASAPRVQSNVPGAQCPIQIDVRNRIAYVMDVDAGVSIFDVTDVANPLFVGSFPTEGAATEAWSNSNQLFVLDKRGLSAFPLVRSLPASRVR